MEHKMNVHITTISKPKISSRQPRKFLLCSTQLSLVPCPFSMMPFPIAFVPYQIAFLPYPIALVPYPFALVPYPIAFLPYPIAMVLFPIVFMPEVVITYYMCLLTESCFVLTKLKFKN